MFPRPRFYFWRIAPANKSFLVLQGSGGWGLARSSVDACGDSEVTVQGLEHVHPCGHVRQLLEIRDRGEPGSCHTRDGPPCAPGSVQGRRGKEATSARWATGTAGAFGRPAGAWGHVWACRWFPQQRD